MNKKYSTRQTEDKKKQTKNKKPSNRFVYSYVGYKVIEESPTDKTNVRTSRMNRTESFRSGKKKTLIRFSLDKKRMHCKQTKCEVANGENFDILQHRLIQYVYLWVIIQYELV